LKKGELEAESSIRGKVNRGKERQRSPRRENDLKEEKTISSEERRDKTEAVV